jgi:hypothetical protein
MTLKGYVEWDDNERTISGEIGSDIITLGRDMHEIALLPYFGTPEG